MKRESSKPEDRRPKDPLLLAADAALRRAALKAQERARAVRFAAEPKKVSQG